MCPASVGLKLTRIVQESPTAKGVDLKQLLVSTKSRRPLEATVTVIGLVAVLVNVNGSGALVVEIACSPKVTMIAFPAKLRSPIQTINVNAMFLPEAQAHATLIQATERMQTSHRQNTSKTRGHCRKETI